LPQFVAAASVRVASAAAAPARIRREPARRIESRASAPVRAVKARSPEAGLDASAAIGRPGTKTSVRVTSTRPSAASSTSILTFLRHSWSSVFSLSSLH
jgi:hypothetical protein